MPVNRWTPDGELHVFTHLHEVPDGFLSKHPDDPNSAPIISAPAAAPMERAEILAALVAGNVPFSKNAQTPALYAKLRASLVEHLTSAGVAFDPDADAKALLGLCAPEA